MVELPQLPVVVSKQAVAVDIDADDGSCSPPNRRAAANVVVAATVVDVGVEAMVVVVVVVVLMDFVVDVGAATAAG